MRSVLAVTMLASLAALPVQVRAQEPGERTQGTAAVAQPPYATAQEEGAAGTEHPVQVALFFPVQVFPETAAIRGVRISLIYGKNTDVTGLDIGLVSHTTRSFLGVQFGFVGVAEGDFTGAQLNGVVNFSRGTFQGLQWGTVNSVEEGRGLQFSGVSVARQFRGLQIGIVNYAESLDGVQLGIVNIIKRGGAFPVLPLVNWGTGGDGSN